MWSLLDRKQLSTPPSLLSSAKDRSVEVPSSAVDARSLMQSYLMEFLVVVSLSKRTQAAIFCAVLFFIGIQLVGDYLVHDMTFNGPLAALSEVIREKVLHRYEKAAWVALVSFLLVAARFYRKDRLRLLYS